MKTTLLSLVLALSAANAFALEVNGPKAQNLYNALEGVGAMKRQFTEASIVSVSGVRAGTALTARGRLGHVEMKDNNTGKVVRFSDAAGGDILAGRALVDSMKAAGLKEEVRIGGSSIDASAIQCTAGHMIGRAMYQCSIKK